MPTYINNVTGTSTAHYFIGYSTLKPSKTRSWALYDLDLIKRDLLNNFHTRKGERIMRPTFGCDIWDYIGEQMTEDVLDAIKAEVTQIVEADERLACRSVNIYSSQNSISCTVDIFYRPYNIVDQFRVDFEARQ
jgi:phage baseplate assembly protein W